MARILMAAVMALGLVTMAWANPGDGVELSQAATAMAHGDYAAALTRLAPLAEQGNARAQDMLGDLYFQGLGVSQDTLVAAKWYRRAAEQGCARSQTKLGIMYEQGRSVPQDYGQALEWFRRAAAAGDAMGQYWLGVMYAHGLGVPRNDVTAYTWIALARRGSLDDLRGAADQEFTGVARRLTPTQLRQAEQRVRAWRPAPAR